MPVLNYYLFGNLNLFQASGDIFHLIAMLILIVSMCRNKSCQGISGKTQLLFSLVFTARYLDLFSVMNFFSVYLSSMKIIYIILTNFTVFLIYWLFRSEKNRQMDSFRAEILVFPLFGLAFFITQDFSTLEIAWTFSVCLESVAIVPQLFVIQKTGYAEDSVVYYLFALAAYKALYICNWIYKYYIVTYKYYNRISTFAGCIQTLILFTGLWLAHSANGKPKYKDLVPQIAIIPSPLVKSYISDRTEEKIAPIVCANLAQSAEVIDEDEKTLLYSPDV